MENCFFQSFAPAVNNPIIKNLCIFFLIAPYSPNGHYKEDEEQLHMFNEQLGYLLWVQFSLDSGTVTVLL